MKIFALLLTAVSLPVQAQIYADFAVSAGGSSLGNFRARLDYDKAPRTCANFIGLASGARPWVDVTTNRIVTNQPFYNGRIFHRLIHNFMIQGGSSDGQGSEGSGYVIQDEFHADLRHSGRYMLSMAKTNLPGTGNSQFFITLAAANHLNDKHSVFGEVIEGRSIIDNFANPALFPTGANDRPLTEISIDSVTISGPSLASFNIHDPALELPAFKAVRPIPSRNSTTSFTTTFDREPGHDYLYAYSLDLASWVPFLNILSVDSEAGYPFTVSGVTFDRFFVNLSAVDYSFLQNPTSASIPAGWSIVFTTRAGATFTLTPNGSGGGTWAYSAGGSGSFSGWTISDMAPASGAFSSTSTQAYFIPLLELNFTLDAPGGPANRQVHQLVLDFREPQAGWSDGTSFLHAFTIQPPPPF